MIDLGKIKKVHFVGIGGIGVSALARMFLDWGKTVSGSDLSSSNIIKELAKLGAEIFSGHQENNVSEDAELLIYSPAADETNPELLKAKKLKIPILSYPQALALASQNYSLIAVAGTHGKTTATAMLAKVLMEANFNPTVVVGSLLNGVKTNYISGKGKYFIAEACEYKRSFLSLNPHILIITNIDLDHLDYYKNLADIQNAFAELTAKLSENDFLVCDVGHQNLKPIIAVANCKILDYKTFSSENLELKIPGKHNIENAQAVLAVADILKIDKQLAVKSLNNFEGTWRRFEYKGKTKNGVAVYDDYAHNPTELKATLKGAREFFGDKKITVIFQPHLYSRTKIFLNEFAKSFADVDKIIILPIYVAREKFDASINSEMLVEKIKKYHRNVIFAPDFNSATEKIKKSTDTDILITIGAGDVWKVGEMVLKN